MKKCVGFSKHAARLGREGFWISLAGLQGYSFLTLGHLTRGAKDSFDSCVTEHVQEL